jgi:hypothetical protein
MRPFDISGGIFSARLLIVLKHLLFMTGNRKISMKRIRILIMICSLMAVSGCASSFCPLDFSGKPPRPYPNRGETTGEEIIVEDEGLKKSSIIN